MMKVDHLAEVSDKYILQIMYLFIVIANNDNWRPWGRNNGIDGNLADAATCGESGPSSPTDSHHFCYVIAELMLQFPIGKER